MYRALMPAEIVFGLLQAEYKKYQNLGDLYLES